MGKGRSPRIRRIALTTGGGDAPGLNAVIRGVVMTAHRQGWECFGIRDGYDGLLEPGPGGGGLVPLTPERVQGITQQGGTILGTTNAGNPLSYPVRQSNGKVVLKDRSTELVRAFRQ